MCLKPRGGNRLGGVPGSATITSALPGATSKTGWGWGKKTAERKIVWKMERKQGEMMIREGDWATGPGSGFGTPQGLGANGG